MLNNITPEQRQVYLEQGRIARQEKIAWAADNLDMEWGEDEKVWKELFSLYGVRSPQRHIPASQTKYLKKMMKTVGANVQEYLEACGCKTLAGLVRLNPRENAVASCGFFIEYWHEKQTENIEYLED